jgi:hypothetical protein
MNQSCANRSEVSAVFYLTSKQLQKSGNEHAGCLFYCKSCNRDYCIGGDKIPVYCANCPYLKGIPDINNPPEEFRFACLKRCSEYSAGLVVMDCPRCRQERIADSLLKIIEAKIRISEKDADDWLFELRAFAIGTADVEQKKIFLQQHRRMVSLRASPQKNKKELRRLRSAKRQNKQKAKLERRDHERSQNNFLLARCIDFSCDSLVQKSKKPKEKRKKCLSRKRQNWKPFHFAVGWR